MPKLISLILCSALVTVLGVVFLELPTHSARLAPAVAVNLEASGVSNPITAVLLNFRSYDTLLEVAVLLLALVGTWAVGRPQGLPTRTEDPAVLIVLRLFVPPIILVAAYFLWVGAAAPGGAFQGGALLAGGLILLIITGRSPWFGVPRIHRLLLAGGLIVFLGLAIAPTLQGQAFLQFPSEHAKYWILVIEAAALMSIAFTLAALFIGGRPKEGLP